LTACPLVVALQESFLEDINNILNSGEVPNLWLTEDQEQISAAMRPLMAAAGIAPTKQVRSSRCPVMSRHGHAMLLLSESLALSSVTARL
jgi:hypothetical protein